MAEYGTAQRDILDWLRTQYGIEKATQKLQNLAVIDADGMIAEVKKIRGAKKPLSVTDVRQLKDEHARSVTPLKALQTEAVGLERQVSDLVNAAYRLSAEEVALVWKSAPPRMPVAPPPAT